MKTNMILKMGAVLGWLGLMASCAPSSNSPSAQNFQSADSSRIIGGVDSTNDYQKQNGIVGVLMIYQTRMGDVMTAGCTSSLIAKNVVVTAAHCLVAPPQTRFLGAVVYFSNDQKKVMVEVKSGDRSNVRTIDRVLRHEDYLTSPTGNHDIGLIHFAGETPDGFQLANRAGLETTALLKPGASVTLAGFGVSDYSKDPQTGKLSDTGSGLLRQIDNIPVVSVSAAGDEIILDQSEGHGACHGDSGGPAYLVDAQTHQNILVGVTSRGTNPQGLCDQHAIYTSIAGYADWIDHGLAQWAAK